MFVIAFSPRGEVFAPGLHLWPSTSRWTTSASSSSSSRWALWFRNSVVIGLAVTAITVIVNLLAGYAFAKLRFRGRNGCSCCCSRR